MSVFEEPQEKDLFLRKPQPSVASHVFELYIFARFLRERFQCTYLFFLYSMCFRTRFFINIVIIPNIVIIFSSLALAGCRVI